MDAPPDPDCCCCCYWAYTDVVIAHPVINVIEWMDGWPFPDMICALLSFLLVSVYLLVLLTDGIYKNFVLS